MGGGEVKMLIALVKEHVVALLEECHFALWEKKLYICELDIMSYKMFAKA